MRTLAAGVIAAAVVASVGAGIPASAAGTPLRTLAEGDGIYFGLAINPSALGNSGYSSVATTQPDMITPENAMKWDTTEPSNGQFNFGPGDQVVSFAQSHNDRVRGHNLVWHSQLPGWVSSTPSSQVKSVMENHITTEVSHYKGKIYAWDVVNEPFNDDGSFRQDVFYNAFGGGVAYIADALRTAHAADPNAKLYINDYNIEGTGAKSNAMYNLISSLKSQGVPIDGVGFESHFIVGQVPSSLQSNMARFAALGVDVAVTELDDRMPTPASSANLQQQATDFSNVFKACLAVSRCPGVTQWDVGDADSWVPGTFPGQGAATMWDNNYQPKAAYTAVQQTLSGGSGGHNTVTVTNPGGQTGTVGTPVSVQINATGSGTASLTYTATGLPAGLSINGNTGLISGTPTASGTSTVTVTATDSTGASGSATFTFTITGGGTGNTVTVTNPGNQTGTVGTPASVQVQASDSASGQTLTYGATGLPAGLSISASTGLISGTPTAAGSSSVTVTATDGTGASGSASFTWTVSSGQTGGGGCHVTYQPNQWQGGFTANVTIANTSSTAINGWTLTFTFPGDQKITSAWSGVPSQSGENVSITNASYNGTIPANGSTSLGFQGTWSSSDASPTSFAVNGTTCS